MRRQIGSGLARWLRRYQNGPHTTKKSGSSLGENSHNIDRGTGPSVVAFKALLRSEREAALGSGSGSPTRLL